MSERTPDKPRFVAGAIGPTNRTASISPDVGDPGFRNISFDELAAAYREAAEGLIEGGCDLILIETVFDTLNAKAALFAVDELFEQLGIELPVMVSGTITDLSGRNLSGQTAEAFWNSVRHARPLTIGLNCALGAAEMRPHIAELARVADTYVCAYPNAGLPNEFGSTTRRRRRPPRTSAPGRRPGWSMSSAAAAAPRPSTSRRSLGGRGHRPPADPRGAAHAPPFRPRAVQPGLVMRVFINIGERTNVTGSAKFRKLILAGDYAAGVEIAREQVADGAQIIDVNMDEAMLDSEAAMLRFLNLIATEPDIARVPVMVDSSKWSVIEAGLKCFQGKGIVNSISLKEGEEPFLALARRSAGTARRSW